MEALILVATLGGPTMFARIGVMRAPNRNVVSFQPRAQGPESEVRAGPMTARLRRPQR